MSKEVVVLSRPRQNQEVEASLVTVTSRKVWCKIPAHTRWLTTISNSRSKGFDVPSWPLQGTRVINIYVGKKLTDKKTHLLNTCVFKISSCGHVKRNYKYPSLESWFKFDVVLNPYNWDVETGGLRVQGKKKKRVRGHLQFYIKFKASMGFIWLRKQK